MLAESSTRNVLGGRSQRDEEAPRGTLVASSPSRASTTKGDVVRASAVHHRQTDKNQHPVNHRPGPGRVILATV